MEKCNSFVLIGSEYFQCCQYSTCLLFNKTARPLLPVSVNARQAMWEMSRWLPLKLEPRSVML